jgi:hypothetical protein
MRSIPRASAARKSNHSLQETEAMCKTTEVEVELAPEQAQVWTVIVGFRTSMIK